MMNTKAKLMLTDTNKGISAFFYPTDYSISGGWHDAECEITGKVNLTTLSDEKRHELLQLLGLQ